MINANEVLEDRVPVLPYILNDMAVESLLIKCLYGESTIEEKVELKNQVHLMQDEIKKWRKKSETRLESEDSNDQQR